MPPVADLCQKGHGGCSKHANCSQVGTVVTCTCLPAYEGDGWSCRARNPCLDGHRGGCSEHADCFNTGPVSRRGAKQPVCRGPTLPVPVRYLLSACRTRGAVSAIPATWVMGCSVWRSLNPLWTDAWQSPHRATQMLCAQTYISRVCLLTYPRPTAASLASYCPVSRTPSFFLQKNRLASSTSRPPVALMA